MKYLWTTIHVNNLEESIQFYEDLIGLKVMQQFPAGPGIQIAFMGNGIENETIVELFCSSTEKNVAHSESLSLGFAVDSIESMQKIVQDKGIDIFIKPFETPKFKWFGIKDPNGVIIQFFQQK